MSDADYAAIGRLQSAYADIVTRRAWPELATIFRPDCVVEIDLRTGAAPLLLNGPTETGQFIDRAIAQFDFFQFVVLNTVVELSAGGDPDLATARLYMNELRHDSASGRFTHVYGLYQDRYRRVDGRWWFDHRWYATLARTAPVEFTTFPFPDPPTS